MVNVMARFKMTDIALGYTEWATHFIHVVDDVDYSVYNVSRPPPADYMREVSVHNGSWYILAIRRDHCTFIPGHYRLIVELLGLGKGGTPLVVRDVYYDNIHYPATGFVKWYLEFIEPKIPPIVGKVGVRNMPI